MSVLTPNRPYIRSVGDEPLPGYRLVAPLGQGGFGEVWKCVAPGGLQKAIKFVLQEADEADDESSLRQEYDAFLRVKGIRHPFLMTLERVELIRDELIMVMELADESLLQRYETCQNAGQSGIDRRELLAYMVDIAEALDVLSGQHGLQHLDIKPANLFLLGGHVKVGDYGLVARYRRSSDGWEPRLGRGLTPKYVAPEVLSEKVNSRTDQYSLALVYFELLTGGFPYSGRTAQQLMIQHASAEPDLRALPDSDRLAVGKALRKSPEERFTNCLAFVKALLADVSGSGSHVVPTTSNRRTTSNPNTSLPLTAPRGLSTTVNVASTHRINAGSSSRPGAASVLTMEELALVRPDWQSLGDQKSDSRGRLVRAVDRSGKISLVKLLRLEGGSATDLAELFDTLQRPLPGLCQEVAIPHPQLLAISWNGETPTLKDFLAKSTSKSLSRVVVSQLLEPLGSVLDNLFSTTGWPHMLLSSSVVSVQDERVQGIMGYGIGEALRRSRDDLDWLRDHPYAAPEALAGRPGAKTDQYSLALLYLELRRAWMPETPRERGGNLRINWNALPKDERTIVTRALAQRPDERYESCEAFLAALRPAENCVVLDSVRHIESVACLKGRSSNSPQTPPLPQNFSDALIRAASAGLTRQTANKLSPILRQPDGQFILRFPVKLSAELAKLKLSAFITQFDYRSIPLGDAGMLLKPIPGRGHVELVIETPLSGTVAVTEIVVSGRSTGLDQGPRAVEQVVAALETFRRAVQNADERRTALRWRTDLTITLYPVDDELTIGSHLEARLRDVSTTGFAAIVPGTAPTGHAFVAFHETTFAEWAALARIVRTTPLADGTHLVGGRFVFADQ